MLVVSRSNNNIVISGGRQGLPGVGGGGSGGLFYYEHIQGSAATDWIVNHNLGARPNVSIKTLGGNEVDAEVLHLNNNQVQIFFDMPTSGIATFS